MTNQTFIKFLSDWSGTQGDFARGVGATEATISRIKAGTVPRPPLMAKIAKFTNNSVPVESWFDLDGPTP